MGKLKIRGTNYCLNHGSSANRKKSWGPLQMWNCDGENNEWILDPKNNRLKACVN
jgi:hypothetical protein